MKRCKSILLSFTTIALLTNPVLAQSKAAVGFEKLKSLVGEWQGTGPHGKVKVSYQLISGGSALMEILDPISEPSMVTIYHLGGDKLAMTHYCSIGNQPRMRAEAPSGEIRKLNFTFADVTNMTSASQGHMRHLTMTFQGKDRITQVWTWRQDGEDTPATFTLERKK
ncbi:hypothetical protein L0337_04505 [candidate division KSB1 bacterium]|nr:hypothetical protein [candidate division KSB1 bacterium]